MNGCMRRTVNCWGSTGPGRLPTVQDQDRCAGAVRAGRSTNGSAPPPSMSMPRPSHLPRWTTRCRPPDRRSSGRCSSPARFRWRRRLRRFFIWRSSGSHPGSGRTPRCPAVVHRAVYRSSGGDHSRSPGSPGAGGAGRGGASRATQHPVRAGRRPRHGRDALPADRALLGAHGTTFDDYFVTIAVLPIADHDPTGRTHNRRVVGGGDNGVQRAYANGIEQDTVATWLHGVGYTTSLTGKYSTATRTGPRPTTCPRVGQLGERCLRQPALKILRTEPEQTYCAPAPALRFGTNVYTASPPAHPRQRTTTSRSSPIAGVPHQPATPAPADVASSVRRHRTPSFDQADVSRMPRFAHVPRSSRPRPA